jgi:MFS family permease
MYPIHAPDIAQARQTPDVRAHVARTVWFLGLTSFFTDISSEMVASTLPLYLVVYLGLTPLQFGFIDGLYQGTTALVRLLGGIVSDRWNRYKEVAFAGYALSALTKPGLIAAGTMWPVLAFLIALDRTGKGLRTAPRDAMIRLSSRADTLGVSFGIHRALDASGAMLGPLLAFLLLNWLPNAFDALFVISFCVALVGLYVLLFFVRTPAREDSGSGRHGSVLSVFPQMFSDRRLRAICLSAAVLSVATVSDSFLYLTLYKRAQVPASSFPLLAFATAMIYMIAAVPFGKLADQIGRSRVFLIGYGLLGLAYIACLLPNAGLYGALLILVLLGAYYAATDGVLAALTSSAVRPEISASALAFVTTVTSLSRLVASVLFGWVWKSTGHAGAIAVFAAFLTLAVIVAAWQLECRREPAHV